MMDAKVIDTIFFDLGRVIIDFDHLRIARRLLEKEVRKSDILPEELFSWLFDGDQGRCSLFDRGHVSAREFFVQVRNTYDLKLDFYEFSTIWNENFREILEVSRLIEELSSRYPLYLISNTNPLHFEYIVEHFPVLKHFQSFILSYREGLCKPDPKIYHAAITRAGTQAHRSLYIDDIEAFVRAAGKMGFHTIHFTSPENLKNRLATLLPSSFSS